MLTTTRVSPVSRLVVVTVTPGSTAPESSVTTPSIAPLMAVDWAAAGSDGCGDEEEREEQASHVMGGSSATRVEVAV